MLMSFTQASPGRPQTAYCIFWQDESRSRDRDWNRG